MASTDPVSVVPAGGRFRVVVFGRNVSNHKSLDSARKRAAEWRQDLSDLVGYGAPSRRNGPITDADLDRMAERVRNVAATTIGDGKLLMDERLMRSVIGNYRTDGQPAGIGYRSPRTSRSF